MKTEFCESDVGREFVVAVGAGNGIMFPKGTIIKLIRICDNGCGDFLGPIGTRDYLSYIRMVEGELIPYTPPILNNSYSIY